MASRSYVGWGTSVSFDHTSALLVFNGGKNIYGFWMPEGSPALVKVSGYDVAGISVAESGSAYVVSWTDKATCLVLY
jgi:hypothetical protein